MAKLKSKARLKRIFNELIFLRETYEDSLALFKAYNEEFEQALNDTTDLAEDTPPPVSNLPEEKISSEEVDQREHIEPPTNNLDPDNHEEFDSLEGPEIPAWMKKLFKNIARETHPDAIHTRKDLNTGQKEERKNIYKNSLAALESLDGLHLLEAGLKLGVNIPLEDNKQQDILSSEANKIKQKLSDFDALVSWLWGENEGNISVRTELLLYARGELKLSTISKEILEKYVVALESGHDLEEFKKQYFLDKKTQSRRGRIKRKTGAKPGLSVASLRKNK